MKEEEGRRKRRRNRRKGRRRKGKRTNVRGGRVGETEGVRGGGGGR